MGDSQVPIAAQPIRINFLLSYTAKKKKINDNVNDFFCYANINYYCDLLQQYLRFLAPTPLHHDLVMAGAVETLS